MSDIMLKLALGYSASKMLSFKLDPIPKLKLSVLFLLIFTHGGFRIAIVAAVLTHISFLFSFTFAFYYFLLINFSKVLLIGFVKEFPLDFLLNFSMPQIIFL